MGLKSKLARLQKAIRGNLSSFELRNGTTFWYEPGEAWQAIFLHGTTCLRADFEGESRPDPPEILQAVAKAKDRRAAVERLYPPGSTPFAAYDVDALIERGTYEPRSFLAGVEYGEEYFERLEDLSEP